MERGLLWLPLLFMFIWLAWSGWNEYQKVETYRLWAAGFERSKYDIYAVLGQKGHELTWGVPTRKGIVNPQTLLLANVKEIRLRVNGQVIALNQAPSKGRAVVEFACLNQTEPVSVPFTEPPLAAKWAQYLQTQLEAKPTVEPSL